MRKILLIVLVFSLFVVGVNGEETIGPELVIEATTIEPFPVIPGKDFDLFVELRNSNTRRTVEELEFSLSGRYPFSSSSDNVKIESLAPNERVLVNFKVKTDINAVGGVNELNLVFEEINDIRYVSSDIFIDIESNTKDLSILSVKTVPSDIEPGDEIKVVIGLKNNVPVLMKEIELDLDLSGDVPFTPIGGTDRKTLDSLTRGGENNFVFSVAVDADAESKVHKIPLSLGYKDEFNNNYTFETTTGLKVVANPKLSYNIEDSEVKSAGGNGDVEIKIVNLGLADVKFLNVELLESRDYDIISVPTVYLGNLESDDYETADFKIYTGSNKEEIPLVFKVTYKDAFNEEYEVEKELMLPLYSKSELTKFGLGGNGGLSKSISYLIFIIFIYIFIVEWKKERNIPKALKNTVGRFLKFFKRIIKGIRIRTLKRVLLRIILFFKEP